MDAGLKKALLGAENQKDFLDLCHKYGLVKLTDLKELDSETLEHLKRIPASKASVQDYDEHGEMIEYFD